MPLSLGTLDPTKPETLISAIQQMSRYIAQLENVIQQLKATQGSGSRLTMEQIRSGLSATGTHPLNVTGLPGTLRQDQPTA